MAVASPEIPVVAAMPTPGQLALLNLFGGLMKVRGAISLRYGVTGGHLDMWLVLGEEDLQARDEAYNLYDTYLQLSGVVPVGLHITSLNRVNLDTIPEGDFRIDLRTVEALVGR
jgi:hypothetical protein